MLTGLSSIGYVYCRTGRRRPEAAGNKRKATMNKKLMLLVVGVLAVLAFTALAGSATAKETKLKCEGAGECTYTVAGGESRFSLNGGDTVWCTEVEGNGTVTGLNAERESTTSNVRLLFKNCKEQATIFHFACTNNGNAGQITTNIMQAHNVALGAAIAPNEAASPTR